MKAKNFKNDLYHTINSTGIDNLGLLSGCLYTNADNTQEHPAIKLVSAITNHKKKSINKNNNSRILIYKNNKCIIFLNNWKNLEYFTAFFLSFFLFGITNHVSTVYNSKKGNILLKIWGK